MAQNTSSAVMQQRSEPHDSLDYFPTPPWATRALCEMLHKQDVRTQGLLAEEPACAVGDMSRPLDENFAAVRSSDGHEYGFGDVRDFLWQDDGPSSDWIITNPPFKLAKEFALTGVQRARQGVALLVRTSFSEGVDRYKTLFRLHPPTVELVFVERVPMVKGRLDPKASTATSYVWMVWQQGRAGTAKAWIPPCRKRLERPEDYARRIYTS